MGNDVDVRRRMTSSRTAERYTGEEIAPLIVRTFGGPPDVDPASSRAANVVIGARRIITRRQDGRARCWSANGRPGGPASRAWINPPSEGQGDVRTWWIKAQKERAAGHVSDLLFLVFRVDALQSMTLGASKAGFPLPQDAWQCQCMRRLTFWTPGEKIKHAMHGSIVLLQSNDPEMIARFHESFGSIGPIVPPRALSPFRNT